MSCSAGITLMPTDCKLQKQLLAIDKATSAQEPSIQHNRADVDCSLQPEDLDQRGIIPHKSKGFAQLA
jgi:hypothetical protein